MVKLALLASNTDPMSTNAKNPFRVNMLSTAGADNIDAELAAGQHAASELHLDHYFECIQHSLPVLNEEEVRRTLEQLRSQQRPSMINKLQLYMALAIGACLPAVSEFTDSYCSTTFFLGAFKIYSTTQLEGSLDTARVMILFTIYSLLNSSAGSSWHLRGLLIRNCISLGLHSEESIQNGEYLKYEEIQDRRTIFWSSYVLDRLAPYDRASLLLYNILIITGGYASH